MAKKKGVEAPIKPVLSIAAFCTRVLEGTDGLMSGIRFLDDIVVGVPQNRDPQTHVDVGIWTLIAFKFTQFGGEHLLRFRIRTPTGKKTTIGEFPLKIENHAIAANIRIRLDMQIKTEGRYWADVILDGKRYASMPLRISFAPMQGAVEDVGGSAGSAS